MFWQLESFKTENTNGRPQSVKNSSRGQIVVEYVLLLSVAVAIALIIVTQLAKRDMDDPENSGALVKKWRSMQEGIGQDKQN